jgi:hypothetical protein
MAVNGYVPPAGATSAPVDPTAAFQAGVVSVDTEKPGPTQAEQDAAKEWLKKIKDARDFDENARARYAIDRAYADDERGDFTVLLPIAGTYIDILKAFLFARDPDVDVQPADSTQPPPMAAVMDMARTQIAQDPQTMALLQQAGQAAQQQAFETGLSQIKSAAAQGQTAPQPGVGPDGQPTTGLPPDPNKVGEDAMKSKFSELMQAKIDEIMKPYSMKLADAKQFGQTLQTIISHVWKTADLKGGAKKQLGSALTIALGWLKITWQERDGTDPITTTRIADLKDNLWQAHQAGLSPAKYETGLYLLGLTAHA